MAAALPMHMRGNFWIGIDKDKKAVDHETIMISKKAKHEAEWFCHQPEVSMLIRFPKPDGNQYSGSPFADSEFLIPGGGSVLSGPPRDDAPIGVYKYDVYVIDPTSKQPGTKPLLDPKIIIEP